MRAHTSPVATQALDGPNPCTLCHTGKPLNWAIEVLSGWKDPSPWRMEN
jgi:hypothetical protein